MITLRDDLIRDAPADLRFQRLIMRFHRLGPRPLYEFLVELSRERLGGQVIESKVDRNVERLEALGPEILAAAAAIHEVSAA